MFADQINQLTIIATYKNKMKSYCLKSKKGTENIDRKVVKNKNPQFVKKQEAEGLLSNLGINTPFSKISLLNVLF